MNNATLNTLGTYSNGKQTVTAINHDDSRVAVSWTDGEMFISTEAEWLTRASWLLNNGFSLVA